MRTLFLAIAGAAALFMGSMSVMPEAQAQPYGYGYRRPPPPGYYGRRVYRPRCYVQRVRVWNGRRYVIRNRRVCR